MTEFLKLWVNLIIRDSDDIIRDECKNLSRDFLQHPCWSNRCRLPHASIAFFSTFLGIDRFWWNSVHGAPNMSATTSELNALWCALKSTVNSSALLHTSGTIRGFHQWQATHGVVICIGMQQFLGAFAKLRKATISFMSVRPPVLPHGITWHSLDGFLLNLMFQFFRKSVEKIQVSLKFNGNN